MADINVWDRPQVVDALDSVLQRSDDLDLVMAQIPGLFGESEKATYLGFRAIGLSKGQALEVLGKDELDYVQWAAETPEFEDFEYKCLYELQSKISADIVRLGFLRNMTMFLFRDQTVIRKSLAGMEDMTGREFAYLRAIRRHYTNHDLLALEKAVAPEKHRDNTLVLSFGNNAFEVMDSESGNQIRLVSGDED